RAGCERCAIGRIAENRPLSGKTAADSCGIRIGTCEDRTRGAFASPAYERGLVSERRGVCEIGSGRARPTDPLFTFVQTNCAGRRPFKRTAREGVVHSAATRPRAPCSRE